MPRSRTLPAERSSSSSVSSRFRPACRVPRNIPRRASSSMLHTWSAGRRMVMATQPAVVAGGMTICTRSPVGRDADNSGASGVDPLLGGIGDQFRQSAAPIEIREWQGLAVPARREFQ